MFERYIAQRLVSTALNSTVLNPVAVGSSRSIIPTCINSQHSYSPLTNPKHSATRISLRRNSTKAYPNSLFWNLLADQTRTDQVSQKILKMASGQAPEPSNSLATDICQTADISAAPLHPPMLSYVDNNNHRHEIYIAPGHWNQANDLLDNENWDALSQFPPWSDQPALSPRQTNVLNYIDRRNRAEKSIFLPQDTAERAVELFIKEDWAALEREFEDWSKYGLYYE